MEVQVTFISTDVLRFNTKVTVKKISIHLCYFLCVLLKKDLIHALGFHDDAHAAGHRTGLELRFLPCGPDFLLSIPPDVREDL